MSASKRLRGTPGTPDSQTKPGIASPLLSSSAASSSPDSPRTAPFGYAPFALLDTTPARYGTTVRWRAPPTASPPLAARPRRRRSPASPIKPTFFDSTSRSLPYGSSTLLDTSSSSLGVALTMPPLAGPPNATRARTPTSPTKPIHRTCKPAERLAAAAALMHDSASSPLLAGRQETAASEAGDSLASSASPQQSVTPRLTPTPLALTAGPSPLGSSPLHSPSKARETTVAAITSLYRNALARSPSPARSNSQSLEGSPVACSASLRSPSLTPPPPQADADAADTPSAAARPPSLNLSAHATYTAGPLSTLSPAEAVPKLFEAPDADNADTVVPDFLTRLFTPESNADSAGRAVDAAWSSGGGSGQVRPCLIGGSLLSCIENALHCPRGTHVRNTLMTHLNDSGFRSGMCVGLFCVRRRTPCSFLTHTCL